MNPILASEMVPGTLTPTSELTSHLIFALGGALYGAPAWAVREVLALPSITALHELPPLFRGVSHLRDQFVPVLDFQRCVGAPVLPSEDETQVLVVLEMGSRLVAIAVDEVRDVRPLPAQNPGWVPRFESPLGSASCLAGVARLDDQNLQLLHLPRLFELVAPFFGSQSLEIAPVTTTPALAEETPLVAVVRLGEELFGLPILWVREFAPLRAVTPVPGASNAVVGLTNLRGEVLSLLDIRPALQLSPSAEQAASHVVVVECDDWRVGIVVDEVLDVFGLPWDAVSPSLAGDLLGGTAWFGDQILSLLDVPRLLSQERQDSGEL